MVEAVATLMWHFGEYQQPLSQVKESTGLSRGVVKHQLTLEPYLTILASLGVVR